MKETGLLNKLKKMPGKTINDKVNKMNAKTLLIKIAQSQKFKEVSCMCIPYFVVTLD